LISIIAWMFAMFLVENMRIYKNERDILKLIDVFIDRYVNIRDDDETDAEFYKDLNNARNIMNGETIQNILDRYLGGSLKVTEIYRTQIRTMLFMLIRKERVMVWALTKVRNNLFMVRFYNSLEDYDEKYDHDNIILEKTYILEHIAINNLGDRIIVGKNEMFDQIIPFFTIDERDNLYKVINVKLTEKRYGSKDKLYDRIQQFGGKTNVLEVYPDNYYGFMFVKYNPRTTQLYMRYPNTNMYAIFTFIDFSEI